MEEIVKQAEQELEEGAVKKEADEARSTETDQEALFESETPETVQSASSSVEPEEADTPPAMQDFQTTDNDSQLPDSEQLIDQNIFYLLGIHESGEEEKDKFLEELQQVIWEDFLENDLEKLLTTEQKPQVDEVLSDAKLEDLDKQEKVLELLEEMIPDLDELMKEKALEFKQDLVMDRVNDMKSSFQQDSVALAKIAQAETEFEQGNWKAGSILLNEVSNK